MDSFTEKVTILKVKHLSINKYVAKILLTNLIY